MVLGRIPRAKGIQEVCIFCALHADTNLVRASRRLHIGRSNRKAAEATAIHKNEEPNTTGLFSTRYTSPNPLPKSDILDDRKQNGNTLYGARYSSKETPSWKRRDTSNTKGRPSESDPVIIQNNSQGLPLHRSYAARSGSNRDGEKRSVDDSSAETRHSRAPNSTTSPGVRTSDVQQENDSRMSRQRTTEAPESQLSSSNPRNRNSAWKQNPTEFGIRRVKLRFDDSSQQTQTHSAPRSGQEAQSPRSIDRAQYTTSTREDPSSFVDNKESTKDVVSAGLPQARQENVRWTQLAPRVVPAPKSDASQEAIPRFMPLEKSPILRPRRLESYTMDEDAEAAKGPKFFNLVLSKSEPAQEPGRSEFIGFQTTRTTEQDYTPRPYKPDSDPTPKVAMQSNPREPEAPSRFKERRRNMLQDEDEGIRTEDKRSKAKKSKSSRRRKEDEEDDDIDPEKLEKIEERQRRKAAVKAAREDRASGQSFIVPSFISIGNLATALKIRAESFGKVLRRQGFEKLNNDHVLDAETAGLIATELGFKAVLPIKDSEIDLMAQPAPESTDLLPSRPPVVTIMGHVDHGKTTLLDWLRNSSIAASEHGGITQHIGAFTVQMPSGRIITFLDTPGHAAFLEMRARGANVTDIVILVVAADDSVKPQTIEAIRHAKAAHTQIVVAISKIDKPEADADRVKQDLARHGIEVEDYGGDTQTVSVSGKTGQGMDQLEDAIIALADVLDVKADPTGPVEGWVLEGARKSSGKTATILVRRGTMRAGQIIVAGNTWARIRNLRNEAGVNIEEGLPGTPVEIDGWHEQPEAGSEVLQAPNEQRARRVVDYRIGKAEIEKQAVEVVAENEARRLHEKQRVVHKDRVALLGKKAAQLQTTPEPEKSGLTEVPIIIKADVSGSAEAVNDSILALGNSEVRAKVIRTLVGRVSESDIELAVAAEAYIVNFNVELDNEIVRLADRSGIRIVDGSIIYKVMDDVKAVLEEKLPPRLSQHVTGEADIMQTFEINLKGKKTLPVAGCRVKNGLITKNSRVKVVREGDIVYDGLLSTLKNVKKDVAEMRKGSECGISFDDFSDFAPGDQIQCYEVKSEKRYL